MENLDELADGILQIYRTSTLKFPYEGFKKLFAVYDESFDLMVPDFDLFTSYVRGYSSSPQRFLSMLRPELARAREWVGRSFYEMCPEYKDTETFITVENTPDLLEYFQEIELMRTKLCLLIEKRYEELK